MSVRGDRARDRLDRQLRRSGERITLERHMLGPNSTKVLVASAECWAKLTNYTAQDVAAGTGIQQQDVKAILSSSELDRQGWPGAAPVKAGAPDPRIPKNQTDRVRAARGSFAIQDGRPTYVDGVLVRLELQLRGG